MKRDLDELLAQLAPTPGDAPLDGLEVGVWRRVAALRGERTMGQLRLGAVAMALVIGLTAGGLGALTAPSTASELAVFSLEARLSPLASPTAGR